MTQNVVLYTVIVAADNADGKLLPYLTANVQFEVQRRSGVLLVPNAALRWQPEREWIAPDARGKAAIGQQKSPGRAGQPGGKAPQGREQKGRIWVQDGRFVQPIDVQIGPSDGIKTEISGGAVREGLEVIVGTTVAPTAAVREAETSLVAEKLASSVYWLRAIWGQTTSSRRAVQKTIASMGTNQLWVLPGALASSGATLGPGGPTLTPQDADEIARQCPTVSAVAPIVRARTRITYGNRNWVPSQISGTTPSFLVVRDWNDFTEGQMFADRDVLDVSKVCVIGETIKREVFQGEFPLNKEVRINNVSFRVIGVLARKGANIMGMDQDDVVLAPWTTIKYRVSGGSLGNVNQSAASAVDSANQANTLSKLYPGSTPLYSAPSATQLADNPQPVRFANVDQILVKAASTEAIPEATAQITELLRQRHHIRPGEPDDFNIRDMTEMTKTLSKPFGL
jgi:hypothetical protein